MSKSWEYYQQTELNNNFTLYWICGLASARYYPALPRLQISNNDFFRSCLP